MKREYRVIGAASGWGAQVRGCEKGAEALKEASLLQRLVDSGLPFKGWDTLFSKRRLEEGEIPFSQALPLIHEFNLRLAELVQKTLDNGEFPLVLGGDHSIAVGTWNGVYQHLLKKKELPLGLIWIDAHMDAHTPKTTPSGAWHGMPLAALLGYGDPTMAELVGKEPVLQSANVCLIGIRSFEEGEAKLLKNLGVKIIYMPEVHQRGIGDVLLEAVEHVTAGTRGFGVSLDLDSIDPTEAPAVGSPEPNGLKSIELIRALKQLHHHKALRAFEIVEYNPERNHLNQTANICYEILKALL